MLGTHNYGAGAGDAPSAVQEDVYDEHRRRMSSVSRSEVSVDTAEDHCYDDKAFVEVEASRRAANLKRTRQLLFVSHSWRDSSMQLRKRLIVAHLSKAVENGGGGHPYWADWLDLQAQGPVPWRNEVEEGIATCSKFVAIVDAGWLCSYNCLQELALAFAHRKPVVCIVLSQEAWELLTVPGGAEVAMAEANKQLQNKCELGKSSSGMSSGSTIGSSSISLDVDFEQITSSKDGSPEAPGVPSASGTKAKCTRSLSVDPDALNPHPKQRECLRRCASVESAAHSCWSSRKHGVPLLSYRGHEIIPGMPLSKEVVQDLFMRLSSINLCPAREVDETIKGMDGMLETVGKYVEKDLNYHKEHTELKNLSMRWDGAGRADRNLLPHKEGPGWDRWLDAARSEHKEPEPTKLQEEFVAASHRHYARRRRISQAVALAFAAFLVAAAVVCGVLAVSSNRARGFAMQAEGMARALEAKARASEALAELRALEAREEARVSRLMSMRMLSMTALGMIDVTKDCAESWELKIVYAVLSRLTGPGTLSVGANALSMARTLLGMDIDIAMQTVRVDISDADGSGNRSSLLGIECKGVATYSPPAQGKVGIPCSDGDSRLLLIYALRPDGTVDDNDQPVQTIRYGTQAAKKGGIFHAVDPTRQIAAYSPDGSHIVVSTEENVYLWPVMPNGTIHPPFVTSPQILAGHQGDVSNMDWSPDGRYLLSSAADGIVKIWSIPADSRRGGLSPFCADTVMPLVPGLSCTAAWSPSSWQVAVDCLRGPMRTWKVLENGTADLSTLQEVPESWSGGAASVTWSPNGKLLVAGDLHGNVRLWKMSSNGSGAMEGPVEQLELGAGSWVITSAFSPDGRSLAVGSFGGVPQLKVWRILPGGTADPKFKQRRFTGHTNPIRSVRWSPSGTELMTTSTDSSVRVWDVRLPGEPGRTGQVDKESLDQVLEVGGVVQYVTYSPSGRHLAAGGNTGDVFVWTALPDGKVDQLSKQMLTGHTDIVRSLAWSPSGPYLASGSSDLTIRLWRHNQNGMMDPMSFQVFKSGHTAPIQSLSWSPGGTLLASGSRDNSVKVWAVGPSNGTIAIRGDNEAHPQVLQHPATVDSVAFSPSGLQLASSCRDGSVLVWPIAAEGTEIDTGRVQVLKGHTSWAYSVSWAPDGRHLASGGMDYTIRVWPVSLEDSKVGAPQVLTASEAVWSVAWSPSGDQIAMGGAGPVLAVWTRHQLPDAGNGGIFPSKPSATIAGQSHRVTSVNWDPAGSGWIASSNYNGTVKVQKLFSVGDMRRLFHNTWPRTNWTLSHDEVIVHGILPEILSFPETPLQLVLC